MKTTTKKIIATITAIAAITTSLCACSDEQTSSVGTNGSVGTTTPVTENASMQTLVDSQMDNLVEQSERFYTIYLRCKIDTEEYDYSLLVEDGNGFKYAPVKEFTSISQMKAETEKYFTEEGAEKLFYTTALEGVIPYYKEDDNGKLVVIADYMSVGENKWVSGSAKITEENDNTATVNVKYTDIYDLSKSADFSVINENGTLKITNIVYNLESVE